MAGDRLITTGNGGHPWVLNDFRWALGQIAAGNQGIYQAINNMLRGFGDNFIVQGVVASGTTPNIAITEGWIMLAGELLKVDAQTGIDTTSEDSFTKVTTNDTTGAKTYLNGATVQTYQKNRGVVDSLAGTLDYNGNTLSDLRSIADVSGTDTPLKTKIIEIGDWNMDADATKFVAHGITNDVDIRSISVKIRHDTVTNVLYPLSIMDSSDTTQGGVDSVAAGNIILRRKASGFFDAATFNATSFNRGWITIQHVD